MKIYSFLLLIVIIPCFVSNSPSVNQGAYTPKLVVELWRHGARAAAKNSFHQDYVVADGPGNLIGNGLRMHYVLGQSIKEKYKDSLFKEAAKWSDYEVTSSEYQRTMLSAYSHMMGIYPEGTGLEISNDIPITKEPPFENAVPQPAGDFALPNGYRSIPVNVIPKKVDDIFLKGLEFICSKGDKFVNDEFAKKTASQERMDLVSYVAGEIEKSGYFSTEYFKEPKWTIKTAGIFSDVDKCFYYKEGTHMGKEGKQTVKDIAHLLEWVFGIYYIDSHYPNDKFLRYYTSNMTKYILAKMEAKMDPENPSLIKYAGLSGHETNIIPFMLKYKLTSEECMIKNLQEKKKGPIEGCASPPKFAANFMWELSQDETSKKWFVSVLYNNIKVKACENPDANLYCSFEDFKTFMNTSFILQESEFKEMCVVEK